MSKVVELLGKLGLEQEQIEAITAENSTSNVTEIYTELRGNIGESLKNDESFISPIKSAVRGEVLSSKERKLMKQFGVTQEEYDALPNKTKFDSLIALCGDKSKPAGTSDEVKAEIEKLRSTLADKDERIKKLTEEDIPAIRGEIERERLALRMQEKFNENFSAATQGKKLLIPETTARSVINTTAHSKYEYRLEGDELVPYQKGSNFELKAFGDNNKPLTAKQIIENALEENQLIRKSNAGDGADRTLLDPSRKIVEIGSKRVPPGLAKAKERSTVKD